MRVLAVASQKGGVGKSAAAVNLGAALAEAGERVRRAAYWERRKHHELIREALEAYLGRLEKKRGEAYPDPPGARMRP